MLESVLAVGSAILFGILNVIVLFLLLIPLALAAAAAAAPAHIKAPAMDRCRSATPKVRLAR